MVGRPGAAWSGSTARIGRVNPTTAPALREALVAADFTFDRVAEVLGQRAHDALARNETTPGLARTRGGSPVETLARLFLLQTPVSLADAERALPGLVDRLAVDGPARAQRRARSPPASTAARTPPPTVTTRRRLWVVSDLTPGLDGGPQRVGTDHVLGISPASTSLAQLTIRDRSARALDLGTGCGVQALHLARHSGRVVATDVNPRALRITRFNAALNEVEVDVRDGSFFEPGARREVRPDRDQPAVRHLARHRRAPRLPRLRAARRPRRRGHRAHRPAPPQPRRLVPGAGQLGDPDGPPVGRAARRLAARGPRRAGRAARGARPGVLRRAVAQGRRPARRPRLRRPLRHLAVVVRRAGHRGDRLRLDQPARRRSPPAAPSSCSWPYDVEQPIAPAVRAWGGRPGSTVTARRPPPRPARRGPGDPRRRRRRGPRDDRAAPAGRVPPRAPGRHRRGGAGRRLRRRPQRRADPRRGLLAARPRPGRHPGAVPAGRRGPGRRGVPHRADGARLRPPAAPPACRWPGSRPARPPRARRSTASCRSAARGSPGRRASRTTPAPRPGWGRR